MSAGTSLAMVGSLVSVIALAAAVGDVAPPLLGVVVLLFPHAASNNTATAAKAITLRNCLACIGSLLSKGLRADPSSSSGPKCNASRLPARPGCRRRAAGRTFGARFPDEFPARQGGRLQSVREP